jgi:hypothetical protein
VTSLRRKVVTLPGTSSPFPVKPKRKAVSS